jgi:hypothetical protein
VGGVEELRPARDGPEGGAPCGGSNGVRRVATVSGSCVCARGSEVGTFYRRRR